VLIPYSEVMLVEDDGNEIHDRGARGELYVKGPQIEKGYWRNAEATEDTFGGGWLKTGDVGVVDAEGWIWIVDRKKVRLSWLDSSPGARCGERIAELTLRTAGAHQSQRPPSLAR
jgi:acyl-CoA synthetase (AMP-forming)/AMP-acid ligase II